MLYHYEVFNRDAMKYYRALKDLSSKVRYTDVIKDDKDYYCAKEYFEKFEEEIKQHI